MRNPNAMVVVQILIPSVCLAIKLSTDEWKEKKVVLFAVPGAFTVRLENHELYLPFYDSSMDDS